MAYRFCRFNRDLILSRDSLSLFLPRWILNPRNSKPFEICTIRVFSRLSVTPSLSRIFVVWARAFSASARVRQVTTQSSAHRVSRYPGADHLQVDVNMVKVDLLRSEMTTGSLSPFRLSEADNATSES